MGLVQFLRILVANFLHVLSWPSFTLVCLLYASIRAIESDTDSDYQHCLTYWVLFSVASILELALAKLLMWLPIWPYAKGIAILLLVTPQFDGASYVYMHFIRPYLPTNLKVCDISFINKTKDCMPKGQNRSSDALRRDINEIRHEEVEKLVILEGESVPDYDAVNCEAMHLTSRKKVQKEWSCALCSVSTSSEKCFQEHLKGKWHKMKIDELENDVTADQASNLLLVTSAANGTLSPKNLNQMAWLNQKFSSLLSSVRLCKWTKPEYGWTKLNTDGSVDRNNAGIGGLLRNYKGKPICAYVSKASGDDIFLVELWAVWRGLVLASGLGIKLIWVESDSMSVVKTINKKQPYAHRASSCLKRIWGLLEKFDKYIISHSWRESNRAADYLSKVDLKKSDVVLCPDEFPNGLREIIKDDAGGRWYRRG